MKKPKRNDSKRIKRKNQNSRKRALKANKQKIQSLTKRIMNGKTIINDTIQLYPRILWPNQAIPN